jgi:tetratricopeptide (TPR) repeat protein
MAAAVRDFNEALSIAGETGGPRSLRSCWIHLRLGSLFTRQGDLARGERHLSRAWDLLEEIRTQRESRPEFIQLFSAAADRFRARPGELAYLRVDAINELARLRRAQGRLLAAEALFRDALQADPHMTPALRAGILSNLAALYHDQSRFGEGEELLREALAILDSCVGDPSRIQTHAVWYNLAVFQRSLGRYAEAADSLTAAEAVRVAAASPQPAFSDLWGRSCE